MTHPFLGIEQRLANMAIYGSTEGITPPDHIW